MKNIGNNNKYLVYLLLFLFGLNAQAQIIFSWPAGGMNALIPVNSLLKAGFNKLDQPKVEHYGTSSGAIVAALLSAGYTLGQVKDFFEQDGAKAFGLDIIVASTFASCGSACLYLGKKLKEIFAQTTLSDLPRLHVFAALDNQVVELSQENGFGHILVADAVMASASITRIFGKVNISGLEYFDPGELSPPMLDPSPLIIKKLKNYNSPVIFSMSNGFSTSHSYPIDNFFLLIPPDSKQIKDQFDNINLAATGQDLITMAMKKNALLALLLVIVNPAELNAKIISSAFHLKAALVYSAMTNKAALQAFARLGHIMFAKNRVYINRLAEFLEKK